MDEAKRVLERLERIERLDRDATPARVVIDELRALVTEAEAWAGVERGDTSAARRAIGNLGAALSDAVAQATANATRVEAVPPE